MKKALQLIAQRAQFGSFLCSVDVLALDRMFHHIKKVHINAGSQSNIKNVFQFFAGVLHHGDGEAAMSECLSKQRNEERAQNRLSEREDEKNGDGDDDDEKDGQNKNQREDKDLW